MLLYQKITSHRKRAIALWAGALLVSLLLNMTLFGLMPILISSIPEPPDRPKPVRTVTVARLPKAKTPPANKTNAKPLSQKTITNRLPQKTILMSEKPLKMKNLPFEINPELPALPNMLPTPPMATAGVQGPGVKGIFEVGELDADLIPLTQTPPVYPYRAKRLDIEGWVKVQFVVNEKGQPEEIRIIEAQPASMFEKNVIQCVSGWRFKPGTIAGVPVKTLVSTTVKFELE